MNQSLSPELLNLVTIKYDTELRLEYQNVGMLQPSMFNHKAISGYNTIRMYKYGQAGTQIHIPGAELTNGRISNDYYEVRAEYYSASKYFDPIEMETSHIDLISNAVHAHANAFGRRIDAVLMREIAKDSNFTVGKNVINRPGLMTVETIVRARTVLDNNFVGTNDRYMMVHPNVYQEMLNAQILTSRDFVEFKEGRPIVTSRIPEVHGFKVLAMPEFTVDVHTGEKSGIQMEDGKYPSYFFQGGRGGFLTVVTNDTQKSRIDWSADKGGYMALSRYGIGGALADAKGIVKVLTTANDPLATE